MLVYQSVLRSHFQHQNSECYFDALLLEENPVPVDIMRTEGYPPGSILAGWGRMPY